MQDIYFEPNYGKIYEELGEGTNHTFVYSDEYGKVSNMFLIRDIPNCIINGVQYKDITTPYGYGGPVVTNFIEGYKDKLIDNYINNFREYCLSNHIVSEFIRFHPIIENAKDFSNVYPIVYQRKTVGTNLTVDDPFTYDFSKSARKQIRKILQDKDISYNIQESPDTLDDFMKIYYSTMDRNAAESIYYFPKSYFDNLCLNFKDELLIGTVFLNNIPIAMGLYFAFDNKYLHAHLSGTLSEYLKYSPAYILKYALMEYGKIHNYSYIHYGGGTTTSEEDSLLQFKRKFGKQTIFDFYIGKKIWQPEMYQKLCEKTGTTNVIDYFPAYRATKG